MRDVDGESSCPCLQSVSCSGFSDGFSCVQASCSSLQAEQAQHLLLDCRKWTGSNRTPTTTQSRRLLRGSDVVHCTEALWLWFLCCINETVFKVELEKQRICTCFFLYGRRRVNHLPLPSSKPTLLNNEQDEDEKIGFWKVGGVSQYY